MDNQLCMDGYRVTLKATLIAVAAVIGISVAGCFSAFLRYDLIGTGHLPRCALFIVVLLMLLSAAAKRLFGKPLFSRAELLFIYCTILIMTGIPGQQYADYLYLSLVGVVYYSTPRNLPELAQYNITSWLDYIPAYSVPSKDPRSGVVNWVFEGMSEGQLIPWQAWVLPLTVWTGFYLALFFTIIGIAALLRRQWVDSERLTFPLAHVPAEMVDERRVGALIRSPLMWACFSIPVFIYTVRALHIYFPSFPDIDIYRDFGLLFTSRPWNMLNHMPINYYFDMIGITYLVTSEVGFSFWFFYLFRRLHIVARTAMGLEQHWDPLQYQTIGGMLTLFALNFWVARRYLLSLFKDKEDKDNEEPHEPIPYRSLLLLLFCGMVLIFVFCRLLGLSLRWSFLLFSIHFIWRILLTRMVAEAGLFVFWTPAPHVFLFRAFGNKSFTPRDITALNLFGWKLMDSATCLMPQALQGLKIAQLGNLNHRQVFNLLLIGTAVSVLSCHVPSVHIIYTTAVPKMGWWMRGFPQGMTRGLLDQLVREQKMKTNDYLSLIGGGAATFVLGLLRWRFLWWPFHPLGFVALNGTWFGDRYGFSIFLGWLFKFITLKFGGIRLWTMFKPAAMGLILGNTFILFILLLLHFFWPTNEVVVIE